MRVAVIGASGFVGAALVERLMARSGVEVVPCIHTSGSAGQVARLGIPLTSLDLLDRAAVERVLRGCTHVVNCSRGENAVMFRGLGHLLKACRDARVERFVHLSSVAVYGDPPASDSVTEDGRTEPAHGSYGWIKLSQDRMVAEAAAAGLPSIILCPPNISGVQSVYLQGVVNALLQGGLALMDEGRAPCNLVDVRNLVHAIELALGRGPADGSRLFVTDDDPASWGDLVESLRPLTGEIRVPGITRDELRGLAAPAPAPRISLGRSLLHLVSSDVRQALRKDPLWARVDTTLRNGVRVLGGTMEDKMRLAVEGPAVVPGAVTAPSLDIRLCAQQLRNVVHGCERARRELGYRPTCTFVQSMAAFRRWYGVFHGWDTPVASLLRAL